MSASATLPPERKGITHKAWLLEGPEPQASLLFSTADFKKQWPRAGLLGNSRDRPEEGSGRAGVSDKTPPVCPTTANLWLGTGEALAAPPRSHMVILYDGAARATQLRGSTDPRT